MEIAIEAAPHPRDPNRAMFMVQAAEMAYVASDARRASDVARPGD